MKKTLHIILGLIAGTAALLLYTLYHPPAEPNIRPDAVETRAARSDYYFRMLRDPATNTIPEDIRTRELDYARTLPERNRFPMRMKSAAGQTAGLTWNSAGPVDVGGRTRALGIDRRNPDIVIAGGVSGGIWKSTDGGSTWDLKTDPGQNMSVTSLVQHPLSPDIWYYASGEISGNSATDRGFRAIYFGTGIYRSADNGETWSRIAATADDDVSWNSPFDRVSRIAVSPAGSIFIASNGLGIYRSTDGEQFSLVQGGFAQHRFADIAVASDGRLAAVLSSLDAGDAANDPGVFISGDDGVTWTEVTPPTFPAYHERSVTAFAPSDPDKLYILTYVSGQGEDEDVRLHYLDLEVDSSEDRSDHLPDFGGHTGYVDTQINYNMAIAVKPDDPDFLIIGGTNLFRSADGFATAPSGGYDNSSSSQKAQYWIGGYHRSNDTFQSYPAHHPDQHVLAFDPVVPDRVWSGHDGALSLTEDVTAAEVTWQDRDDGYVTSQFYTVALSGEAGDARIMGGTQDNGTPFFRVDSQMAQSGTTTDISSGDGSYAFFGESTLFTSTQNGNIIRYRLTPGGDPNLFDWTTIHPVGASGQLFIHPYAVDPNDERIVYYPGGSTMWKNTRVDQIPDFTSGGSGIGWESYSASSLSGYTISALAVSAEPAHVLYYGASSSSGSPEIYRVDDAHISESMVNISIPGAVSGAYVHDIALNPTDADEAIVVLSNYNIVGLYHTTDGGGSWSAIEGNLEGDGTDPGPSLRSAAILPAGSGNVYLVGTSTGIYSTETLSGTSTVWTQEASDIIGHAVTERLASRASDGTVAVATHGRGIFMGSLPVEPVDPNDTIPPGAPAGPVLTETVSGWELNWTANTESDLARYRIYRGPQLEGLSLTDSVGSGTTRYPDPQTVDGPLFYAVSAVDQNGNESGLSEAVGVYQLRRKVEPEWTLVSIPTLGTGSVTVPGDLQMVAFSGSYRIAETLEPGKGYWIRSAEGDSLEIGGEAALAASIPVRAGWNLVGGLSDKISTASIADPDGVLSVAPVYSYDGLAYQMTSSIEPLQGYWIHADWEGTVHLSAAPPRSASERHTGEEANGEPVPADRILFSGESDQTLLVARNPVPESRRTRYLLPPLSPDPPLDVRTGSHHRMANRERTELLITARSWPVNISVEGGTDTGFYRLESVSGADTVYHVVGPGKGAVMTRGYSRTWISPLSGENPLFTLHPNFPNPFDWSTAIRYEVNEVDVVLLEVFDILGRRVRTLVEAGQLPGIYTVTFDAQDLSSGTYMIRLQVGDQVQVEKMTLVK